MENYVKMSKTRSKKLPLGAAIAKTKQKLTAKDTDLMFRPGDSTDPCEPRYEHIWNPYDEVYVVGGGKVRKRGGCE